MSDNSKIEKINILNQYKKNKEKYLYYKNQLTGVHSIDLSYVKSSVHPTIIDKIQKKDIAYQDMINSYINIVSLIEKFVPFPNNILMYDIFINDQDLEQLENKMKMEKSVIKNIFYYSLDLIKLE